MSIQVQSVVTGPFQENTFIVSDSVTGDTVFIDPGDDSSVLISEINRNNLIPLAIINTHAHIDHIGAVSELQTEWNIPFYLHKDEQMVFDTYEQTCRLFGMPVGETPEVDRWIETEDDLNIGPFHFEVMFTPGHTPGGITFLIEKHVFSGDTLFYGSIGRTDLPGGDWNTLECSLKKMVEQIDSRFIIHSGHGPDTTMGREYKENPFLIRL
ncbi:MAG: MBL fold metallo-hydrolase [Candidatus Marinimicrobia bacterium]|nr:MBL fold metallo-hydrolase [Candidatus Neomarinimicrobiota bacterium]